MIRLEAVNAENWRIPLQVTAKCLYESFGFCEVDRDEDEIIMKLNI